MGDILIKNGMVVDGTGAKAFAADVRVTGGTISEVGLPSESMKGSTSGARVKRAAYAGPVPLAGCSRPPGPRTTLSSPT